MAYHSRHNTFARILADHMVEQRFGKTYGTHDLTSYFDFVDARQAAHLSSEKVAHASAQRHAIQIMAEDAVTPIAKVPLKDPRRSGATVWAEIELAAFLDLIENGADGAWWLNYAGEKDRKGYVKTAPPLSKQAATTVVTVARLVAGAGKQRIVRFADRNPLNLRRNNMFLMGVTATCADAVKGSKHDASSLVMETSRIRATLAGANYERPDNEGK